MNTNREEKSLRYVAKVAEFLGDNKAKMSLVNLHYFKLHQSYSVLFNLSNVDVIFWI